MLQHSCLFCKHAAVAAAAAATISRRSSIGSPGSLAFMLPKSLCVTSAPTVNPPIPSPGLLVILLMLVAEVF
jgi:hypothetical protein